MIESLVKEEIKSLKPYEPHEYAYKYKLDANESPFPLPLKIKELIKEYLDGSSLNRYPNTDSTQLREKIGSTINIDSKNIMVGNGSDEMIQIIIHTFLEKGELVLSHGPTFAMYKIFSTIGGGSYLEVSTDKLFTIDIEKIILKANELEVKLIFLCTPNNPTGTVISKGDILRVLKETRAIVVVDEAYIEFGGESIIDEIHNFDRLIVLRTFSKAFGAAGIRLGYLVANDVLMNYLKRVKAPYNLSVISELIGMALLSNTELARDRVNQIKAYKEMLLQGMNGIKNIKVYPSQANFILFKVPDGKEVFSGLLKRGVMVRSFQDGPLKNHLRVTVGGFSENQAFIKALKEVI